MQDEDIFGEARRKSENENRLMLVGGALIASAVGAAITYLSRRSTKRNLEEAIVDQQAIALKIAQMSEILDDYLAADYFVLDSNVWMYEGAGSLFDELML